MLQQIFLKDFENWAEYYWTYQYCLARDYYIPMLEEWGFSFVGKRILDVGCGDGGFVSAVADAGAECVGVEIAPFNVWSEHPQVKFIVADITKSETLETLGNTFDMVVLRDVIEHIPRQQKQEFITSLKNYLKPDGRLFMTFPPYYSPFGLHQQTIPKSKLLRKIPYLSWLPQPLILSLMTLFKEDQRVKDKITNEIIASRMPLGYARRLFKRLGLSIRNERFFITRPSHEIRYGWKTRLAKFDRIPILNEILILGTAFLFKFDSTSFES